MRDRDAGWIADATTMSRLLHTRKINLRVNLKARLEWRKKRGKKMMIKFELVHHDDDGDEISGLAGACKKFERGPIFLPLGGFDVTPYGSYFFCRKLVHSAHKIAIEEAGCRFVQEVPKRIVKGVEGRARRWMERPNRWDWPALIRIHQELLRSRRRQAPGASFWLLGALVDLMQSVTQPEVEE